MSAASESSCAVCGLQNMFPENVPGGEPWVTCRNCSVKVHFHCMKNGGCRCPADDFLAELSSRFYISDYLQVNDLCYPSITHFPNKIPYALHWTVDEVKFFFEAVGLQNEALELSRKNVNGFKLLTMSEREVVSLPLTFGSAMRVCKQIKVLRWKVLNSATDTKSSVLLRN